MQLVEDGLVDLDRPVCRYLPGFAVADPEATRSITVRHLLLHVGGFEGDLFVDTGRGDDALDRYLAYLGGHAKQVSAPGEQFSYSNAGYAVLGALVAHLRGATWEAVFRERLLEPLGAHHTALLAEEAILFRAAAGHGGDDRTVYRRWQMPRGLGPFGGTPCAAPRDLVRLGRLLLAGGLTPDGTRLLSPESVAAMTSEQLTEPGIPIRGGGRRGLGPMLYDWNGTAAFGHDGGTIGQATVWRVVPDHRLVVAMNANHDANAAFFYEVLDAIVPELTGVRVPPRPTPPGGPSRPGPARCQGRYAYPLNTYDVAATGDGLDVTTIPADVLGVSGGPARTVSYVALSGSTFMAARPEAGVHPTITFLDGGRFLFGNGRAAARVG
jgi:CubicO group peptidase (beta-lactamase class C family)